MTASPDPYDAPLSALRNNVENLAVWLGIWTNRQEPDAFSRRCGSDAVDAIDNMLKDLYLVRGRLSSELRQADDAADQRADELLHRDGGNTRARLSVA